MVSSYSRLSTFCEDNGRMSFALFLLYLIVILLRPTEFFQLNLEGARPIFWLWVCAFVSSTVHAVARAEAAAKSTHFVLLGFFLLTIVVSQLRQGWLGGAAYAFFQFSTSAGLFVLICLNATTLKRLRTTCAVVLACVTIIATISTISFHTGMMSQQLVVKQTSGDDALESFSTADSAIPADDKSGQFLYRIRGLGFLNDPNDLAQAIVMVLPFLWGLSRKGRGARNLLVVWLPGAVLGYAIYLTHSRGALIALASLFFFGLRRLLGTARTALVMAAGGALVVVAGFGGGRQFSTGEESANLRVEAWYSGLEMLKSNLLLGVGYGNFTDHHVRTAHNSFVLCFAELGVIGYFFWVALIVLVFQGLNKVVVNAPERAPEREFATLLRSSFIGVMTCAWFLSRTYQATLFLLLGLGAAGWYCWAILAESPAELAERRTLKWVLPTLGTMAVAFGSVYAVILLDALLLK